METFLVSTGLVALAEIGDKTQLLAIMLAARYRRPAPIILGILVATLLNHAAAAALGVMISQWVEGPVFQSLVGVGFLAMAAWALIPDKEDEGPRQLAGLGVFATTTVAFFLVEIGDKTQVATTLLAARFEQLAIVTAGTTVGMMLANVPAVFLGEAAIRVVPLSLVRRAAALVFLALGLWVLAAAWIAP